MICSLRISLASTVSTTCAFIHAGKPCLLLPSHLEQFLFSRRVEEGGFGLVVHPETGGPSVDAKLHELLSNPLYRQNCELFRQRYANFPQSTVLGNLERRMLALATEHAAIALGNDQ